ncbi:TolC family protein [Polynucleobacter difficilis]|uniref:TolC family protein n=1 Tax=Polynucleobacter difficilis TaxID=556054 RepID=UPI001F16844A|nr:TolC family protein [Polynucleobacter difficilis]
MTLPFFSVPTHFKRRYLQDVMSAGIWGAIVLSIPASALAQAVNPVQDRNGPAAGQVTVLPDATGKMPSAAQGNQNLSLPPALTAPASSSVPAFSNFSINPRDAVNFGQNIDLMRLYQEAAFNDPVLNSARFNYAANKEIYWQGLSTLLPQVSANPTATRFFQHGEGNSRIFDQKSYTVSLTQPVFNAAALEVFKQGDLITKVSDLQFLQAQQDLVIRVSQAYFDVLTAQDNVELFQNKKALIKQQLQAAQSKFEVGSATIVDANDAQARFDLANAQETAAQAELIVRRGVLEQIVGHPVPPLRPLAKDAKIEGVVADPRAKIKDAKGIPIAESVNPKLPPGQELTDWIKQAEAANYGVLASQLNVDIAQSSYRGSLAANYPTVNFVGTTGFNAANGSPTNFNPSTTQNIFNNTIALQMSLPIFSGGFNNSVIRQRAALVDKAKSDYDNLRRAAAQATRQAFTGFYGGLATVKAFEAAEKSSASALASSQLGFDVGTLINLDVLIALDALFTTRATLYKARYDTILNALRLKAQAAALTDQDLLAVNALLK